jgi:hypothetical protein
MLAQSNPVGNRRQAVLLNLSHAPPITDTSFPLRIMELYEQNVTDPASASVRETRRPGASDGGGTSLPVDRGEDIAVESCGAQGARPAP